MKPDATSPLTAFLAPRHWPTWIGLAILRLLAALPYPLQWLSGHAIGWILVLLPFSRKKTIRKNIALCLPELDKKQQARLVRQNLLSSGMALVEIAMSWWSSDKRLTKIVKIEGLEHLEKALQEGKGVILLSAHFTTLEIGGRMLRLFTPFHVLYRDQKNPLFNTIMTRARTRNFEKAIHRNDIRQFIKSLKENHAVWYAPDQNFRGEKKVIIPFFGVPAPSNPATSRLVKSTQAKVVPLMQIRLPGLQGYKIILSPLLENFPTGNQSQDTILVNQEIEKNIRKAPAQYLWAHNRFKTNPNEDK